MVECFAILTVCTNSRSSLTRVRIGIINWLLAGLICAVVLAGQPTPTVNTEAGAFLPPRSVKPGTRAAAPKLAVAPFDSQEARAHQEAWASHLGQPVEITNSIGMKLRLIPPGEFMMGSPESEAKRVSYEGPQRRVRITRPFYFGVYEVTQSEYERVMGSNPSAFTQGGRARESKRVSALDTSRFPVERVSWEDAVEFCRRLSAMSQEESAGRVYRLPTEAEWEYACRAGTTTPFHFGSVLDGRQANCLGALPYGTRKRGPDLGRPTTVGSYGPNRFGLYDMHGNVFEWVTDWFAADYYSQSPFEDPPGPTSGRYRVFRGGSWFSAGRDCRSAVRGANVPEVQMNILGFRVALAPKT